MDMSEILGGAVLGAFFLAAVIATVISVTRNREVQKQLDSFAHRRQEGAPT